MMKHKEFNIPFIGLKQGKHFFEYKIDKAFFDSFEYDEFIDAQVDVTVNMLKSSTMLELSFSSQGWVAVPCDISQEMFELPIDGGLELIVKFGEAFNDENEEVLILPHGEFQVNIAQYIYEMIVLAVPTKRIHPGIADGTLDSEIVNKLEELQPSEVKQEQEEIDPRWDALKQLLKDNDNK